MLWIFEMAAAHADRCVGVVEKCRRDDDRARGGEYCDLVRHHGQMEELVINEVEAEAELVVVGNADRKIAGLDGMRARMVGKPRRGKRKQKRKKG